MIDFGALPPEINSARMYVGAGVYPLLQAAAAWQAIAAGLMASGAAEGATTAALVAGPWLGPSSVIMGMSHVQFVAWVLTTAARAEATAATAMGAADAYSLAFAATIPPPEVERNQITTATLIATNFFGVNSAAIAASEAQYEEYWAQDASAMYTYAATNSTLAASLNAPPFLPAVPDSDPAGLGAQAAAVGEAGAQAPGNVASTVSGAGSQVSSMGSGLGGLGSAATAPMQAMSQIPQALGQLSSPLGSMMSPMSSMFGGMGGQGVLAPLSGLGVLPGVMGAGGGFSGLSGAMSGSLGGPGGMGMGPMMANMGGAGRLPGGRLSIPTSWANSMEQTSSFKPLATAEAVGAAPESNNMVGAPRAGMMPMGAMQGSSGPSHYPADSLGSLGEGRTKTGKPLPFRASVINPNQVF